jgi:hypothetical protein
MKLHVHDFKQEQLSLYKKSMIHFPVDASVCQKRCLHKLPIVKQFYETNELAFVRETANV